MHTFGALTPDVIDSLDVEDFRALCGWADDYNAKQAGPAETKPGRRKAG